jgi:signal recognition particle GTPase
MISQYIAVNALVKKITKEEEEERMVVEEMIEETIEEVAEETLEKTTDRDLTQSVQSAEKPVAFLLIQHQAKKYIAIYVLAKKTKKKILLAQ